jgi:endonuclease/exonuclease/phosphatase family metal-dependent hydrolase
MNLRIAVWNVQWKKPASASGREIHQILSRSGADIICLTEGYAGLLPEHGHQILSASDYGYGTSDGRRKVLLWSRWPWSDADVIGSPDLPPGRFARGHLSTPAGEISVIGICIPWAGAHVSSGRRDRKRWQDHAAYLTALRNVIAAEGAQANLLVAGDFNQRVPPSHTPFAMHKLLRSALGDLAVCTEGSLDGTGKASIDHVAYTPALRLPVVSAWSASGANGRQLSDHFGLSVDFQFTG